jgi:hypothetical protein
MRKLKPAMPILEPAKTTIERYLGAANRYFAVWPREADAVRARHEAEGRDVLRRLGSTTFDELRARRKDPDLFTGQSDERKSALARALEWMDLEDGNYGGPLGRALFDDFMPSPIATKEELEALENATDEELESWPPVALARGMERTYGVVIISPGVIPRSSRSAMTMPTRARVSARSLQRLKKAMQRRRESARCIGPSRAMFGSRGIAVFRTQTQTRERPSPLRFRRAWSSRPIRR